MSKFFDLVSMRSYKQTGISGLRYVFYKGKPVNVIDETDIDKLRMHKDIFFECDEFGAPIIKEVDTEGVKSYTRFRAAIANRDELFAEADKIAKEKRKNGIDVDSLLKEAEVDTIDKHSDADADDKHTDEIIEKVLEGGAILKTPKKITKKPKNPLECEQCGYISKDMNDLKDHLEKHDEED